MRWVAILHPEPEQHGQREDRLQASTGVIVLASFGRGARQSGAPTSINTGRHTWAGQQFTTSRSRRTHARGPLRMYISRRRLMGEQTSPSLAPSHARCIRLWSRHCCLGLSEVACRRLRPARSFRVSTYPARGGFRTRLQVGIQPTMRHRSTLKPNWKSLGVMALLTQMTLAFGPAAQHVEIIAAPALGDADLARRAEAAGSSCSPEGQWNCMAHTWQRCAGGRWSVVMDSARGTVCHPAGLTSDLGIDHDGGGGAGAATGGGSRGAVGVGVPVAVAVLSWALR